MGDTTKEIPVTTEEIDLQNESNDILAHSHVFGPAISLEIIKGLTVNVGAGLSFVRTAIYRMDTVGTPEGSPDHIYDTDRAGLYAKGGLEFRLPIYKGLFLAAAPEVSYHRIRRMHSIDPDNDYVPVNWTMLDYTVHQNAISWRGDLLTGLDLGWIIPYIGGRYQDFRHHIALDETYLDTQGDTIIHDLDIYHKPSFWATGLAGISFRITKDTRLVIEGSFGKGLAIASKLEIGL